MADTTKTLDARMADVAVTQHGLVTQAQLDQLGLSPTRDATGWTEGVCNACNGACSGWPEPSPAASRGRWPPASASVGMWPRRIDARLSCGVSI